MLDHSAPEGHGSDRGRAPGRPERHLVLRSVQSAGALDGGRAMVPLPRALRPRGLERLPHGLARSDRPEAHAMPTKPELPAPPGDDRLDAGFRRPILERHRTATPPTGASGAGTGSGAGIVAGSGNTSGT